METRQVIAIRMSANGTHPSHITDLRWLNQNGATFTGSRAEMVAFVGQHPGAAFTNANGIRANLHVVQHWVETMPDATRVDNLLSLPRF